MTEAELPRLADIDRSEIVRVGFELHDGNLVRTSGRWDVLDFLKQGGGEHTVAQQVAFCRRHLASGATMIGAFDGEKLVGVGLLTPEIRPDLAQLAYLQVSSPHRKEGIASSLTRRLLKLARGLGAGGVYVVDEQGPPPCAFSSHARVGEVTWNHSSRSPARRNLEATPSPLRLGRG